MASTSPNDNAQSSLTYIDLFAGCGGLSLGLQQARWQGIFAVERNAMAFATLKHNLLAATEGHFPHWPSWFPKKPCSIQKLTRKYVRQLRKLRGTVALIAGGPPCQGFSSAGKRLKNDHRNQLYKSYVKIVGMVRPKLVLLENVTGIQQQFRSGKKSRRGRPQLPYSVRLRRGLERLGYRMYDSEVLASDFGVPQSRTRFLAVGMDLTQFQSCPAISPFTVLSEIGKEMLQSKGLPTNSPTTSQQALSDLTHDAKDAVDSPDSKGFKAGKFAAATSTFQRLMRGKIPDGTTADSHRFVNHRSATVKRFVEILAECTRGRKIPESFRQARGLRKACVVPLDPNGPAPTLTTIPDDMIHYSQPRVLTVRECARLQSFPDSFEFKSKYTTGGNRRKKECPRYTQVGNAVPPLLGEALGWSLAAWISIVQPSISAANKTAPRPNAA